MDKALFWRLIEDSKNKRGDCDAQAAKLETLLAKLDASEIIAFDQTFAECRAQSYNYDLWAVAYIVNEGCSDDGFEYFRSWLISQGQEYFEAALKDPERAADAITPGEEVECEALAYAAGMAYEAKTGQPIPIPALNYPAEPLGKPWSEEDLEVRFPALYKKFG